MKLNEKPQFETHQLTAANTAELAQVMKIFYRNLEDVPSEFAEDHDKVNSGVQYLQQLLSNPKNYVAVETAINEEGLEQIIGAIDAHSAIEEPEKKDEPSKIPQSALDEFGAQKEDVFYIDTIATEKAFEGQGVASRLLQNAENFAREKGYKWVFLRTDNDFGDAQHINHPVCQFYRNEKRGYTEIGQVNDGKETKTHFIKELTNPIESAYDTDIERTMIETVSNIDDIAFSALRGIKRYEIICAPQEILDEWKKEVDIIVDAITTKNTAIMPELMKNNGRITGDPQVIQKIIEEENLDDTDIKLLAIGLFVLREKSPWDIGKSGLKVLKGEKIQMESAFDPDGWANCYDIIAIVNELAKMYGVEGSIQIKGLGHAHFETKDEKVSDPMYAWKRGGLFQNKKEYIQYKKKMGLLRRMGIKKSE